MFLFCSHRGRCKPRSELLPRARTLRVDQTRAEAKLWNALRNRQLGGWKWKRQVPRGRYIVDFYCAEAGLVVELDGGQHDRQAAYDDRRTLDLEESGLRVIRFWNNDVLTELGGVCDMILAACGSASPLPAQRGED